MPSPSATPTPITPPRVALIDQRTGMIAREWYMFFLSMFNTANAVVESGVDLGPSPESLIATYDEALRAVNQELQTLPPAIDYSEDIINLRKEKDLNPSSETGELQAQINDVRQIEMTNPSCETGELQAQINDVRQELEILPKPSLGTLSAVNIDWVPYLGFDTAPPWIGTTAGQFWFDSTTGSFNAKMGNNNITQQVGEEIFIYGKASSTITDSPLQIIYKTGTVGASGVLQFAPATTGITDADQILGVATESIATNGFGRITTFGVVHGITTNGTAFGEVWADNDDIWYNPTTGNPTKVKPSAPNIKVQIGTVINAGSGGSGSFFVKLGPSSTLGGTDSNVQFGTLANGDIIRYNSTLGYWTNVTLSAAGIVTSVTGTSPVVSSGGTTPAISLASGYGDTQNPYAAKTANYVLAGPTSGSAAAPTFRALVAADIPALPYGTGSVTSVSVVSTNGLAGTVANASTTPAITLSTSITGLLYGNGTAFAAATINAPLSYSAGTLSITQSGTSTNGYLSSTDWNTFNNKQPAGTYVTSVTGTAPVVSSGGTTPAISMAAANTSTSGYLTSTDWNTFNNKQTTSAPVTYTANFSVAATDAWVINNKSGSSCTATLPTASSNSGRVLHFQNYQAQTLISASSNVVPLVGGAAGTAILAAVAGDTCTLVSDGSNWIMTQYTPNNVLLLE